MAYYRVMRPDRDVSRDLPADLHLPLRSGEPWWYFIGGRYSTDFANTLRERWWRCVETLVTPADLGRWLERAGLLSEAAEVDEATLESARDLREAIDVSFQHAIEGQTPPPGALAAINAWLACSRRPFELRLEGEQVILDEREPETAVRGALAEIAQDAAEILSEPALRRRLRVCASESCSARFVDQSPAGRRQWCSMRTCGNAAKARRFRARQRSEHVDGH
jgi:predicted RNA-binding Zn ribbon-like protein